jgi:hypothetical protein
LESGQVDPLGPDLRQAAEALEQALTEACASKSAHEADTGELIRIEEMLAVASEAARRAISIRRKARQARTAPGTPAGLAADRPAPASHRLFDDRGGVRWDVWAVYPETRPSQLSALPEAFQAGWLVFESANQKRRLSPIPSDWQTLPTDELERLCERAEIAPRRGRGYGSGGGLGEDVPSRTE